MIMLPRETSSRVQCQHNQQGKIPMRNNGQYIYVIQNFTMDIVSNLEKAIVKCLERQYRQWEDKMNQLQLTSTPRRSPLATKGEDLAERPVVAPITC